MLQPVTQRYEEQPVTPKLDTHEWKAFAHEPQESAKRPLKPFPTNDTQLGSKFRAFAKSTLSNHLEHNHSGQMCYLAALILGWIETK